GIALANKIKNNGKIVMCFIGDGTLGQGIIYEAFNLASLWSLPIVFVLENNKIAQSTHIDQTFSGAIKKRAEGFGLEYFSTNTWDLENLLDTFKNATEISRNKSRATFIEIETFRLSSHSKGDDNRSLAYIKEFELKDILCKEQIIKEKNTNALLETINKQIDIALTKARESQLANRKSTKKTQNKVEVSYSNLKNISSDKRINQLIHEALKEQFKSDTSTIMLGEDIEYITPFTEKPYGGAFKVSNDLSEYFQNVKNTPISESAITGLGTGLSIGGMQPIIEIMFGDFLTLAFDQIYNHACKFSGMYNNQISIPLVIRTPMGGKRGYGPTHSQSLEKHFLGITDLSIIALNYRVHPKILYKAAFSENSPVLVIENKVLYTRKLQEKVLLGYEVLITDEKYPTLKIGPQARKADVTILCYGEVLEDIEKAIELAFEEEEIFCEIICPSQINPINIMPVIESIKSTKRLLTVEEGTNIASYSSEIAALIMQEGVSLKSFVRLSNNEIIPSSSKAELDILPNVNSILEKIKETFYGK
ncbi:MAG: thiamine pyrophosphate-dependent enzyme, partial [Polaribacter sp.]